MHNWLSSKISVWLLVLITGFCSASVLAKQEVHPLPRQKVIVSASVHEPYFFQTKDKGLTIDLLAAMNQIQSQYEFVVTDIPARRVFQSIDNQRVDIVIWDNLQWGWQDFPNIKASLPLINEGDKFIALTSNALTVDYFKRLKQKKFALINGYHYNFLDYEKDNAKQRQAYDIHLTKSEDAALKMLLAKRVDVTVLSESAIAWHLKQHPDDSEKLLVSDHFDSQYSRHFLIPEQAAISIEEVNSILMLLAEKGMLEHLYARYGLTPPSY